MIRYGSKAWRARRKREEVASRKRIRDAAKALGTYLKKSNVSGGTPNGRILFAAHNILAGYVARL